MKFIKLQDGVYLNASLVRKIFADTLGRGAFVAVVVNGTILTVAEFDTAAEAEKYLEELITRLEME